MVKFLNCLLVSRVTSDSLWSLAILAGSPNTQTDHAYFMAQSTIKSKGLLSFDLIYKETIVAKREE